MVRMNTKIGDVFEIKIENNYKKYIQYIANDLTMLNSEVIRAFKKIYPDNTNFDLSEIVKDEVEFYAHCVTKWGIKLGLWEKIGNIGALGRADVLFRNTNDFGKKIGEHPIKVSNNWYVWTINDAEFKKVGKLEGQNRKADIGMIIPPYQIVCRVRTGAYDFVYPGYE